MSNDHGTHSGLARAKPVPGFVAIGILVVFLSGCVASANEPPETDDQGDAHITLPVEKFTTSQDAETTHYVGEVDEQLFIGVAVPEQEAGAEEPRTVAVYLCDSMEVSQWIRGEVTGQEATLDDGDGTVDVTLADESVSGTVTLNGEEPQPFTAELAPGDAGVFRATYSLGGEDYHIDWIVHADGRQRGPLDGKGNDVVVVDPK